MMPAKKFLSRNRAGDRNGLSAVKHVDYEQIKAQPEIIASATISVELNQSCF